MNWKGSGRKQSWNNLRYYPSIYLKAPKETMKHLSLYKWSWGQDLNSDYWICSHDIWHYKPYGMKMLQHMHKTMKIDFSIFSQRYASILSSNIPFCIVLQSAATVGAHFSLWGLNTQHLYSLQFSWQSGGRLYIQANIMCRNLKNVKVPRRCCSLLGAVHNCPLLENGTPHNAHISAMFRIPIYS